MSAPQIGDRNFSKQIVRLADLTVSTDVIDGYTFSHCRIIGPAILLALGSTSIMECSFDSPTGIDGIFWEIVPGRTHVIGVIGVRNCTFSSCNFEMVGIAGPEATRTMMESAFGGE